MNPPFSVELDESGRVPVAHLRGEVDLANAPDVERQLAAAASADDPFVIDLSEVEYIDSSGFGMLERLSRTNSLRVVIPEESVIQRAFSVTGLDGVMPVYATVSEATSLE
jgi:anti-anti-sigma factor